MNAVFSNVPPSETSEAEFSKGKAVVGFVLNPYDIACELPYELAPGCSFERASPQMTETIKSALKDYVHPQSWVKPAHLYECDIVREVHENGHSWGAVARPQKDWRYHVVFNSDDNGVKNINMNLIANITDTPLQTSSLYFHYENGKPHGMGCNPGVMHNYFSLPTEMAAISIGEPELALIRDTATDFHAVFGDALTPKRHPELHRAINMFDALKQLPTKSEYQLLGLFAIIEMLITHNPKLEDRGDSITHQMQTKIPLLANRFNRKLDYASYFDNASEKRIWTALYSLRSSVAHGGETNVNRPDLRVLKDFHQAVSFVRSVVKGLLRHSLKDPQLYLDIKNC
ncbi:MAG: hypothetical protein V4542_00535 [Pseudomonadota bacterium]